VDDALIWMLASAAGALLGAFFFGGLWWTVRQGVASPRPALWFLGSMVLRTGVTLAGFYFVGGGELGRLLAGLLGFLVARLVVIRLTHPRAEGEPRSGSVASHAP
jgi:F1F0 ATPase subunit 2